MYFYKASQRGFHGNRIIPEGMTAYAEKKLSAKWLTPMPAPKGKAETEELLAASVSLDVDASPTAVKKAKAGPANAAPNVQKLATSSDAEIV